MVSSIALCAIPISLVSGFGFWGSWGFAGFWDDRASAILSACLPAAVFGFRRFYGFRHFDSPA